MNLRDIQNASNKLENKSMNELRAMLWCIGVDYPDNATKQQLIDLIKKNQ